MSQLHMSADQDSNIPDDDEKERLLRQTAVEDQQNVEDISTAFRNAASGSYSISRSIYKHYADSCKFSIPVNSLKIHISPCSKPWAHLRY